MHDITEHRVTSSHFPHNYGVSEVDVSKPIEGLWKIANRSIVRNVNANSESNSH